MSNSNQKDLAQRRVHPQQPLPPSQIPEWIKIKIGSHHEVYAVQEPTPQPILSPPALAPIPVSHQPPPSENEGEMFPIPVVIQQKKDDQQKKEEVTNEMSIDEIAALASRSHRTLGQATATLLSSCKNEKENSRKLRAEMEVLLVQLKESEDQTVSLRGKMEHLVKKCEEDVGKAKSEEEMYKNNYVKLSEQLTAIKKESLEKDALIESRKEEIYEQKAKIEAMTITEKKLKEEMVKKETDILVVEERYRKMCQQNAKLDGDILKIRASTTELQETINKFAENDKKAQQTIQNLEIQIVNVKLSAEAKFLQKNDEISRITGDLAKARNDNKVKSTELEKKATEIRDLTEKLEILQNDTDDFPTNLDEIMSNFRNDVLQCYSPKQRTPVSTASSPGITGSSENTSKPVVEGNEGTNENGDNGTGNKAEQLEAKKDATLSTTPSRSTRKKRCVDSLIHNDGLEQISQIHFKKKLVTGHRSTDREIPEVSSSSRQNDSSSSSNGKNLRSKHGSKQ